jgi:decaprenylphospho-beta-D-erythro-pentofuranosid-2-ulose 2-reductase
VKAALFGATRGMGRALARRMAERGDALCLLGRDKRALELALRDLEVRGAAAPIHTLECDLERPASFAGVLERAGQLLGGLDTVVVSAGVFATQEELERDRALCEQLLRLDFVHTVLFCEAARAQLLAGGGGTLCVFSSVAGERARRSVVLYGAAKAGLSHYLEGLDHAYRKQGLVTVTVKPGFVRTALTAGLAPPPFAGEPDEVARVVLRAIDRDAPVVYAPPVWALVMLAIRWLPRFALRRLGF